MMHVGDCLEVLRSLPDASVQCCVTSPPYWGLRDYGVEGQMGSEETPDAWAAALVEVFREVRRVLRDDGTLWLNLGDVFDSGTTRGRRASATNNKRHGYWTNPGIDKRISSAETKTKDLLGLPWLLAFALRADGWYLRSEIIWHKPNPMPESVTDRPSKAHETVFLLSRASRYFYDAEALREPYVPDSVARVGRGRSESHKWADGGPGGQTLAKDISGACSSPTGRNARSVWTIATESFGEAHFATMPSELARRCIRAGTSAKGCCPECGAPVQRLVEKETYRDTAGTREMSKTPLNVIRAGWRKGGPEISTVGWSPGCECGGSFGHHAPIPATVLDPFAGAGTTMLAAEQLGRDSIGIEINPEYVEMAERRLQRYRSDRALGNAARLTAPEEGQMRFEI